jgi:Gpi18-like mannosyltransferase
LYLAPFAALGADLPTVSKISSALFCAVTVPVLLALGWQLKLVWPARIAVVLFALNPEVLRTYGHETPLYVLLMLSAVCCYVRGRAVWATMFCALLLLCRGDGILLSIVLFVGFVVRQRTFPYKQLLLYVAIVAPWFIFATAYFGEPFPSTLHAKILQHQIMRYPSFFDELLKLTTRGGAVAVV